MIFLNYNITTYILLACWLIGLLLFYIPRFIKRQKLIAEIILNAGIFIFILYIIALWINLERAPLRTLGETRLWYSFFLPVTGMVIYYRWKMNWMPLFSILLSILFILINYFNPENFDKTLMPALQSYWFVPHVNVYIFAYALLAASTLVAFKGLVSLKKQKLPQSNLLFADIIA